MIANIENEYTIIFKDKPKVFFATATMHIVKESLLKISNVKIIETMKPIYINVFDLVAQVLKTTISSNNLFESITNYYIKLEATQTFNNDEYDNFFIDLCQKYFKVECSFPHFQSRFWVETLAPITWLWSHLITSSTTQLNYLQVKFFISTLDIFILCGNCNYHFCRTREYIFKIIENHNLDLDIFLIKMHSIINILINKNIQINLQKYAEFYKQYLFRIQEE